jgi:hypothetical protein
MARVQTLLFACVLQGITAFSEPVAVLIVLCFTFRDLILEMKPLARKECDPLGTTKHIGARLLHSREALGLNSTRICDVRPI